MFLLILFYLFKNVLFLLNYGWSASQLVPDKQDLAVVEALLSGQEIATDPWEGRQMRKSQGREPWHMEPSTKASGAHSATTDSTLHSALHTAGIQ